MEGKLLELERGWEEMREKERKYEAASVRMRKDIKKKDERILQLQQELEQMSLGQERHLDDSQAMDDFDFVDVSGQQSLLNEVVVTHSFNQTGGEDVRASMLPGKSFLLQLQQQQQNIFVRETYDADTQTDPPSCAASTQTLQTSSEQPSQTCVLTTEQTCQTLRQQSTKQAQTANCSKFTQQTQTEQSHYLTMRDPMHEFFQLTCKAVKLQSPHIDLATEVNEQKLFEQIL